MDEIKIIRDAQEISTVLPNENAMFGMDVEQFLDSLPEEPIFDLVVTSPPYNIGKEYETVFSAANVDNASDTIYEVFHDLGHMKSLLPPEMWANKNKYDKALDTLFSAIIEAGIINYTMACSYDSTLTATNYLKREKNYYGILRNHWNSLLMRAIQDTFK